jgi:phosphoribosylaminoimidazole-succinocarboxamide synthase
MPTSEQPYLGSEDPVGGLERLSRGKVRDIYSLDSEHLLIVTTDRVSAFDVVMDRGVPHKGRVLTAIAAHWFETTRDIIDNHLVSTAVGDVSGLSVEEREVLNGRVMICRRADVLPVEWVVRGYLAGSGWKEYQRAGTVCGIPLPAGLQLASRLPEPILTPTTKSEEHDEPLTPAEARELVGPECYDRAQAAALEMFARGTEMLADAEILLADTKFELGMRDGAMILIDEALTPDSSRFWAADTYAPGTSPPSYDKQILRDHLETLDWNKEYPPPAVADEVIDRVAGRYLEICERITGAMPVGVPA